MRKGLAFSLALLLFGPSCASVYAPVTLEQLHGRERFYYELVADWQARERQGAFSIRPVAHGPFYEHYRAFIQSGHCKDATPNLVQFLNETIALINEQRFKPDYAEYWPTTKELFGEEVRAEDCDGLELLSYHYLRLCGYRHTFRGLFWHRDGFGHLATLVFPKASEPDPFIIDPTELFELKTHRLSELLAEGSWRLVMFFDDERTYKLTGSMEEGTAGAHATEEVGK